MLQLTIVFFSWYLHLIILIEQNIQIININLNYKVFGKENKISAAHRNLFQEANLDWRKEKQIKTNSKYLSWNELQVLL